MGQWQRTVRERAGLYVAAGDAAATNVTTGGTFVKTAGTTTAGLLRGFTHTNGRLTYHGAGGVFRVQAVATITVNLSGGTVHLQIAKNGTPIASSEQHRKVAAASDLGNMGCLVAVELERDDYLELYCTTDVGQDNKEITAEHYYLEVGLDG